MTSSKANLVRYVPSSSREPYRRVMNSEQVQAHLLAKAREVAERARAEGIECTCDVRPGRMRAHARTTTKLHQTTDFRSRGHNQRVDRALQAALQSIRRG